MTKRTYLLVPLVTVAHVATGFFLYRGNILGWESAAISDLAIFILHVSAGIRG